MKEKGKSIKVYLLGMLIVGIGMGLTTVIADTIINSTNVSYKTSTVKAALDDLYGLTADDIWQKIYPIGSIYTSVSPTSPATLFGGTWERFGNGKAIVGVDESDDDFKTVALTGGSKTKTIAVGNLPAHSHSVNAVNTGANSRGHTHNYVKAAGVAGHKLTISEIPSHEGHLDNSGGSIAKYIDINNASVFYAYGTTGRGWITTGGNEAHPASKNIGGGGSHNHSLNTSTVASGGESQDHSHQVPAHNTNSTGSGTALNTQDPYITVYMWKRTA